MAQNSNDRSSPEGSASQPVSLHQRILGDIEGHILSGAWPPGYRIPFEHELTEQYGCSRMTVNKALTQLAKAGLIERKRRSGSFVAHPQSQAAILEIHDIREEVKQLGLPYRYELVKARKRKAGAADRKRLDVAADASLLDLSCRHFAGPRPFCLEERIINLDVVPEADGEDFRDVAPGPWLIDRVPWSNAEHSIRAVAADRATADALAIAEGAPCLVIERRTWNAGQPITHVRLTYSGDNHALVARFTPAQG
ncbi:histidine utilization repressor [Mesorhizobium sp. RMAD-H1]|uniref:histidine utilization repressor n=1 Tax=Mesorhizobium sp. RMAD-H1 TaxID=2587065 RepID=UPI00161778E1|nr:histidine utilization repressor [Mesorhizobium sp. RMAD-H1]MBB2971341.1 GntR family histidine utilization transcriptional repressor [Mesorhizobium sp. RMAD-H1]